MQIERARGLRLGCLALVLATSESQAQGSCDARSVALDVLDAAAPSSAEHLQQLANLAQSVTVELGASQISVCTSVDPPALTRVQIRAILPDWQRASIRLESASAPTLQRDLDVSKLPPEARALAIASATDELVRSSFIEPVAPSASVAAAAAAAAPDEPDRLQPDRVAAAALGPEGARSTPLMELGLAASASSYLGQRDALEADLAARYWLLPRLPISLRLGFGQRVSRPNERGDVQPGTDFHAALDSGFVLWRQTRSFDLIGDAGVRLSRVGFDQRLTAEEPITMSPTNLTADTVTRVDERIQPLDHDWALAASVGVEGRAHTGPIGSSLAIAGLLPLVPARSDWGNHTSLDSLGVQLRVGVWMLLGSTLAPATDAARKEL